jgi:hypothetical protein
VTARFAAVLALFAAGRAYAAIVGTGQALVASYVDNVATLPLTPDDVTRDVFGTFVNLAADVGGMTEDALVTGNTFAGQLSSTAAGVLTADLVDGHYLCDPPSCDASLSLVAVSSISTMTNLGGTFGSGLPPNVTYVLDITLDYDGVTAAGPFVINAYQANPTPTSPPGCTGNDCNVLVAPPPTTILNSASGEELMVSASVEFPSVTAPGDTTVVGVSNVSAAVPSNLAFNDGMTFLDISTTATFDTSGGPITICVDYIIAGAVSDPTALRLLHAEGGAWVDVTTIVDVGTHTICGAVYSLSPFAVASELPPTTTSTTSTSSTTSTTLPPSTPDLLPGRIVIIKNGKLAKFLAKPPTGMGFNLPDPTNDPTVEGGQLDIFDDDPFRPVTADFTLPASGWKALGNAASKGFKYTGNGSPSDPCRVVLVKQKVVKAVCRGAGVSLVTPFVGRVGIVLTIGTEEDAESKRYCALFGGHETNNDVTLLKRANAPAPDACPLNLDSTTTLPPTTSTSTSSTTSTSATTSTSTTSSTSSTSTTSTTSTTSSTSTSSTSSSTTTTSTSSTSIPPSPCEASVGGFCWFFGVAGASCDATCAANGRTYDMATSSYAGHNGTDANCAAVAAALNSSSIFAGSGTCASGWGCAYFTNTDQNARCTAPATTSNAANGAVRRFCACQ